MATALSVPLARLLIVIFAQGTLATQLTVSTYSNATQISTSSMWRSVFGECTLEGACVESPNYPNNYDDSQECTIRINSEAASPIQVERFDTEDDNDYVTVNGVPYSGTAGPSGITPTTAVHWTSDGSVVHGGWRLCAASTPAPPASPTPTPPDAASATGDPHLSNIRGEHFDVYQPGNMALIHVPRRAEPARTLLLVEAEARRMGDECSVYFQGVTVSGLWTNQSKPIQFLASSRGPPEGRKWKEWVRFGSIDLKVVRRTKGVDYLNVYIRNLGRTSYEVGGLLGLDDHSTVAKRPRQCAHRHDAMLKSSVAHVS